MGNEFDYAKFLKLTNHMATAWVSSGEDGATRLRTRGIYSLDSGNISRFSYERDIYSRSGLVGKTTRIKTFTN